MVAVVPLVMGFLNTEAGRDTVGKVTDKLLDEGKAPQQQSPEAMNASAKDAARQAMGQISAAGGSLRGATGTAVAGSEKAQGHGQGKGTGIGG